MSCLVSVIVVSYNSRAVLPACLRSLWQHEPAVRTGEFEVLLVDNASTDGSADAVDGDFPWVRLIRSAQNLGFGKANNLAATRAAGRYLFLLNPDTELRMPAIRALLAFMEDPAHGRIGAAGALVEDEHGRPGTAAGNFPTLRSLLRDLLPSRLAPYRLQVRGGGAGYRLVDYVSGADLFVRREAFAAAGGFDPDFFLYFEETELQHRLARLGWQRALVERARIMHRCAARAYHDSIERIRLFERSRLLYYRKTQGVAVALLAKLLLVAYYLSRWPLRRRARYLRAAAFVAST